MSYTDRNIELKQSISDLATHLGFVKIGFTEPFISESIINLYSDWLKKNFHSTMSFLQKTFMQKTNPSLVIPEVRTVIMLAYNYYTPVEYIDVSNVNTKISRYALGKSYQEVILPKLNQICDLITESHPGSESIAFVDSGPVMEKYFAQKAGIGWQGKNSLIITEEYGSWIFLGTVFTSVEIEVDTAATDKCGKCNICVESCPTGAIQENRCLDASKCISFITIESKKEYDLPENLSGKLDNWGFGCDICQLVCPKNNNPKLTLEKIFFPIGNETTLKLEDLKQMTNAEFKGKYKGRAIERRKLSGILRNFEFLEKSDVQK